MAELITIGTETNPHIELHTTFAYCTCNYHQPLTSSLKIPAGKYTVEIELVKEQGNNWVVRLVKKVLFVNRVISSDWFLEEQQARTFAEKLAVMVKNNSDISRFMKRKPGWILSNPA